MSLATTAKPCHAGEAEEDVNTGQDAAKPRRRLDLRVQYQKIDGDLNATITTMRMDWPFILEDGWRLNTRIDLLLISNNVPSRDNRDGDREFGTSDLLFQGLLIKPLHKSAVFGGAQVFLPLVVIRSDVESVFF